MTAEEIAAPGIRVTCLRCVCQIAARVHEFKLLAQQFYNEGEQPFPIHGNAETMNINPLLLANIQTTDYFKNLAQIQAFDDFVDQVDDPYICVTITSPVRSTTMPRWSARGSRARTTSAAHQVSPTKPALPPTQLFLWRKEGLPVQQRRSKHNPLVNTH